MSVKKILKNSLVNLSLIFFSLLICFIFLEAGFRLAGYQAIYDTYSKSSLLWQYDPLLGWSHIPNSDAEYIGPRPWPVEFKSSIHINSNSLRGPEIGPKESLRILVLGDSVTVGFEVEYDETYAMQLQKLLSEQLNRPVEVINAGVRGYGTDQSYLYYKERGKLLQADIVLFLHIANDPLNNITLHRMRRPFGKPAFQIVTQNDQEQLKLTAYPTPDYPVCSEFRLDKNYQVERIDTSFNRIMCWTQKEFADYSAFFTYIAFKIRQHPELLKKLYFSARPEENSKDASQKTTTDIAEKTPQVINRKAQQPDKLTTMIIKQFAQTAKENNAHFILLSSADHATFQVDNKKLQKEGVDIITIAPLSLSKDVVGALTFNNDPHWTKYGHRAFAEKVAPQLLKRISP